MIVGRYSIHLYCDFGIPSKPERGEAYTLHGGRPNYELDQQMEFTGKNEAACFRESRKVGWKVYPAQGKAKCPACAKALGK